MKPHAYTYARFSTKRQDKGTTLSRQKDLTRQFCEDRGWEIVEEITDTGRSAWSGDHLAGGNLGKFKQRIDNHEIPRGSYLVVENLDRLSRENVKKARRWIEEVTDAGISVAVCTPAPGKIFNEASLSGENIVDLLQYLLEAQRSHKESERKSEFQQKAIATFMDKARQGIVYTERCPAWLRGEKGSTFEIIEERAAVVRQIYEWCAAGMGIHLIAKKLNASIEPWTLGYKEGKLPSWKVGYVRDILIGWQVEGEYHVRTGKNRTPTGEVITNYYPRVVSPELVTAARTAMKLRAGATGPNHSEAKNLFAGRVKCGHCGDTMVRVVQRNRQKTLYEYLKCTRFNAGAECENTTMYRYDNFERAALDRILHLALDKSHFVKADETGPLLGRVASLTKQVELLEGERSHLMAFIRKHGEDEDVERDIVALRPKLAAARGELEEAQAQLDKARGNATPEEHLARVLEVKDAIYSEDQETREQARRTVRDAIRSIVSLVTCEREYEAGKKTPKRTVSMFAAGNHLRYDFDNDGNQIGGWDMLDFEGSDEPILKAFSEEISASTERQPDNRTALGAVVRRKAAKV
jgi:DNA invertase Pin-like site-specific DNA recombinase